MANSLNTLFEATYLMPAFQSSDQSLFFLPLVSFEQSQHIPLKNNIIQNVNNLNEHLAF